MSPVSLSHSNTITRVEPMAQFGIMDIEVSDDYIPTFCERCTGVFRAAGIMTPGLDLFAKLPIDFNDRVDRDNWARTLWYVFCQIYTCEYDVTQSFQPFPGEVRGLQEVSPSDGLFQPKTLKDIYADYLYKNHGNYWQMGPVVNGTKSVTSIVEFLERRQVTGNIRASRAFTHHVTSKRTACFVPYL